MPKKKKSGKSSNKLLKMTEDERIVYMEQQKLAEDDMRKKKEEMLTQYLKDKLAKEEHSTKFNINKLNHQWRNIMRDAKAKELKKDIEILSQTFERVVDRKDTIIKSLSKDLTEAEEQHAMAVRSHFQNVDNIIVLHDTKTEALYNNYQEEQSALELEFDSEQTIMLEKNSKEINDLQDIMFTIEQNFTEAEIEARTEFHSTRDEIKNKNLEEIHALRVQLELISEELWAQYQTALKNYLKVTEERQKAFNELADRDKKNANEIESQMRKIQRLTDTIAQLKGKMLSNSKESEEKNKQLKEEREMMLSHFQDLKGQMNSQRKVESEKLKRHVIQADAQMKLLEKKNKLGDKILRATEMGRKLETEEEKVLPFYSSSLTQEEEQAQAVLMEVPSDTMSFNTGHTYGGMDNFWKRYNKVYLEKLALEKEESALSNENYQLKSLLKQYLDGISVNDEIISKVNPLLIINHKSNANNRMNISLNDARVRSTMPVMEAAHFIRVPQRN